MSCTHAAASDFQRTGLFKGLPTFSDFEQRLKNLANTKEVGDAFEILVEGYLQTQPTMQVKNVWLVGRVPLRIRKQLNLPSDSKGIDGIFETRTGSLVPYQVKYRTDTAVLPYAEVSSFLGITERSCKDRVLFTNARELSKDIANRDGLRSVRATQFHALTREDFAAIEAWLDEKPVKHERRTPRLYQQEAIKQITEALKTQPRTTAVMACGTGKTLVALWVADELEPKTVLVLVPSLALLSQTLPDWCKESKWGESFEYLCVCSDPTVSKGVDAFTIRPQDADFPITTDAKEVKRFLSRKTNDVKVVFSTYQSAPVVAQGMKGLKPFDFAVFDEAHKTTGPQAGLFAFGLSDKNLPVQKRLFLTATPRHYDIRHRDKEGDFRLVSMDDESVYGPVSYRLSFASAVKQGIICPYKIVISVITKEEVDNELLKHGTTLVKRDEIQARWVATQLALERAIERTKASKVITFHSRVALAQEFASAESRGISQHLRGFEVLHVNGSQSTADRESILHDFRTSGRGLITNARCLNEGVDVPAVDMVAFIDPRRSRIDIAQATGRAMRQSQATGKTTGYIVVPLFLEQQKGETSEQALERSGFEDVAMVIAAMQEQDEDLVDIIRQLRTEKGEGKPINPRALAEKIEVLGPTIALSELRAAVSVAVVDRLGTSWDEMYGHLVAYFRSNGDCLVPVRYKTEEGYRLGSWVNHQRDNRNGMSQALRDRLQSLRGWSWDAHSDAWAKGYEQLKRHSERVGDCAVPLGFNEAGGFDLGRWVIKQRTKKAMPLDRRQSLESLQGWTWTPHLDAWQEGYSHLTEFCRRYGHCRVLPEHKTTDGFRLGAWVKKQRTKKDMMPRERCEQLESLQGWTWNPISDAWDAGYRHLIQYNEQVGGCRVPASRKTKDGFKLGQWVASQRFNRDTLPEPQKRKLECLKGWTWDPFEDAWERGYAHLQKYNERVSNCLVPKNHKTNDGFTRGVWVTNQRAKRDNLPQERRERLEKLKSWTWGALSDAWEKGYQHLKNYSERVGDCRVPTSHITSEGYRLGQWVGSQRTKRDSMPPDLRNRLESLEGWAWDGREARWVEGYGHLQRYAESVGNCNVPQSYRTKDGYALGYWVSNQRQNKDAMPLERQSRLESLEGWVWKA